MPYKKSVPVLKERRQETIFKSPTVITNNNNNNRVLVADHSIADHSIEDLQNEIIHLKMLLQIEQQRVDFFRAQAKAFANLYSDLLHSNSAIPTPVPWWKFWA